MPKTTKQATDAEVIEEEAKTAASEDMDEGDSFLPELSNFNMLLISGFGIALVIIMVMLVNGGGEPAEAALSQAAPSSPVAAEVPTAASPAPAAPAASQVGDIINPNGIERKGEGRHFYTTIRIPPGAETLYLSGSGASRNPDGSWGDMEAQTIDTFNGFKGKLEAEGWSMSDIVQVRAFAVADEYGLLDFDGFNRAYRTFFGTEENPMKPVRSFVEIEDLVVDGWLLEVEVRAARMP